MSKNDFSSTAAPAEILRAQWTNSLENVAAAMSNLMANPPIPEHGRKYDLMLVFTAVADVAMAMSRDPGLMIKTQIAAMEEWGNLWRSAWSPADDSEPVIAPERGDRRFHDEEWEKNPYFKQIKQNYLLASRQLRTMVASNEKVDPAKRAMAEFLLEQFLNAVAPTNFVVSNPEVLRKTLETGGANLVSGFANFLSDAREGRGIVRRRAPDSFTPGKTIAATPGSVVFQNDLMQLIQYDPATDQVRKRPLLYVPPLVNKYYMIDLQPKSSMVRWLVEQGHTVFVISWVDPDESHRHCEIDDYIGRGVVAAMDAIADATGEKMVDLFGFCMGGTLIAITLAYLAAKKQHRVGSATLIGSLVDFGDMREWSAFLMEAHVDALDSHVSKKGYIDKDELQQLFSLVRSNDLIWSSFINHYLLDREAPPSDLLYWFEDGSHIPQGFLRSYNKTFLLDNHLRVPGAVTVLGEALDLTQVKTPITIIALKDDHVSAWTSVYDGAKLFGGPVRFVLGGSGHNAGVINPPSANKHGYWVNETLTDTAETWFDQAEKKPGSWWTDWANWLGVQAGNDLVPARKVGSGKLAAIEAAPGSFVTRAPSKNPDSRTSQ